MDLGLCSGVYFPSNTGVGDYDEGVEREMLFRRIFALGFILLCPLFILTVSGSGSFKPSVPDWLLGTWNNRYESNRDQAVAVKFEKYSIKISRGIPRRFTNLNREERGYRYVRQECSEGEYKIWLAKSPRDMNVYRFMREEPARRSDQTTSLIMFTDRIRNNKHHYGPYLSLIKEPTP
ncbi:MAG TPA: hypothetical protein VHR47_01345 [Bacillota bacterium]|nr:hypothetical protein [Bacillota bacterium]